MTAGAGREPARRPAARPQTPVPRHCRRSTQGGESRGSFRVRALLTRAWGLLLACAGAARPRSRVPRAGPGRRPRPLRPAPSASPSHPRLTQLESVPAPLGGRGPRRRWWVTFQVGPARTPPWGFCGRELLAGAIEPLGAGSSPRPKARMSNSQLFRHFLKMHHPWSLLFHYEKSQRNHPAGSIRRRQPDSFLVLY